MLQNFLFWPKIISYFGQIKLPILAKTSRHDNVRQEIAIFVISQYMAKWAQRK